MGSFEGRVPGPSGKRVHVGRLPWMVPPDRVVPGAVGVQAMLAANDQVAVQLGPAFAWPIGVMLTLWMVARDEQRMLDPIPPPRRRLPGDPWPPPEAFVLGARFADGRQTTTFDFPRLSPVSGERERGIHLSRGSAGGTNGNFHMSFWLWPLPPEGTIAFSCSWPKWGIEETVTELDSTPFREAATRARAIWPDD